MRDKSHAEQVERWARFVKTHPRAEWKRHVGPLVDSQIIMANRFYRMLLKTKNGREKLEKLEKITRSQKAGLKS